MCPVVAAGEWGLWAGGTGSAGAGGRELAPGAGHPEGQLRELLRQGEMHSARK